MVAVNRDPGNVVAATSRFICADIDRKMAEVDLAISELQAQRTRLQNTRIWHRHLSSIVHRLPDDVLAEIFMQAVHLAIDGENPRKTHCSIVLSLTSVSKSWRILALSLPVLWSFLPLSFKSSSPSNSLCAWMGTIRTKSREAPLTVRYEGGFHPLLRKGSEGGLPQWIRDTMPRWRRFTLRLEEEELPWLRVLADIDNAQGEQSQYSTAVALPVQLAGLRHLTIEHYASSRRNNDLCTLLDGMFSSTPELATLWFQSYHLPRDLIQASPSFPWRRLSCLGLELCSLEPDILLSIISATRQLNTLDVGVDISSRHIPFRPGSPASPNTSNGPDPILLPSLTVLSFRLTHESEVDGHHEGRTRKVAIMGTRLAHFTGALALPALQSATLHYNSGGATTGSDSIIPSFNSLLTSYEISSLQWVNLRLDVQSQQALSAGTIRLITSQRQMEWLHVSRGSSRKFADDLVIDDILNAIMSTDNALKVVAFEKAIIGSLQLLADVIIQRRVSVVLWDMDRGSVGVQKAAAAMLRRAVETEGLEVKPADLLRKWESRSAVYATKEIIFSWKHTGYRRDCKTGDLTWVGV